MRSPEEELTGQILEVTHISLWEMLRRSARRWPDRPAVAMNGDEWTYAELYTRSLRAAARLRDLGVGSGTRVAMMIHGCPEWAVLHYALARLGAVAVPVNLVYEPREIAHVLATSDAEVFVGVSSFRGNDYAAKLAECDPAFVNGARAVPSLPNLRRVAVMPLDSRDRPDPRDATAAMVFGDEKQEALDPRTEINGCAPAYIVYTSGSTAAPKPALCSHRAFLGAAAGFAHALQMNPDDRYLAMLPTFHTGGVSCVLSAPHLSGGCVQLLGTFDPSAALLAIQRDGCSVTIGSETFFAKMMAAPEYDEADTSNLRKVIVTGAPAHLQRIADEWNFELWCQAYGSTESGALATVARPETTDGILRRESVGRPLPGIDLVILDPGSGEQCPPGEPGEICFRGWSRVIEYAGMPNETVEAIDSEGYFHSGDRGALDEDGNLYFQGRYKWMIKTGGENVSAREVELFLESELEPVELAQVVGVPDATWGEAVVAFVVLNTDVDGETLREMAKGKIAGFKIPKRFYVLQADEFPTVTNGQPDKGALIRMAAERAAQ